MENGGIRCVGKSRLLALLAAGALLSGSVAQAEFDNGAETRNNGRDLEWMRLTLTGAVDLTTGEVTPGVKVALPADLAPTAESEDPWSYETTLLQEAKATRLGVDAIVKALAFLSGLILWGITVMRVYV